MPNTFEILSGFLRRYGDEVEGRELSGPTPEIGAKLQLFARGQLPASEQAELIGQLNERPDLIAKLASDIKALRPPGNQRP
jgi:hypothetical protein